MDPPKAYGADYLVLLAVAERADKHGRNSKGGVEDIARRANLCHFGDLAEPSKQVREHAMRSARRSLARLEGKAKAGNYDPPRLEDCGAARGGTRNRAVCMGTPDTVSPPDLVSSGSDPGSVSEEDHRSEGDDHRSAGDVPDVRPPDHRSETPDEKSPKPPKEPSSESSEQCAEPPAPPTYLPPAGGGHTTEEITASGLSPFSPADSPAPPAHLAAERAEDERELANVKELLAKRPDDKLLNSRRKELEESLGLSLAGAAA
jgi:hypothetical protein